MNADASWPSLAEAAPRVLGMQTKLHRWAGADGMRRFDDLFNLVYDPCFLTVAWDRVRSNTGARTPGIDGRTARWIHRQGEGKAFLQDVHDQLKQRTFDPVPVREKMIAEGERQTASPRHPDRGRPSRAGLAEAGAGTNLRGGL